MRNEILKYERIRSLRIDRGLTQEAVAEVLHVKQNTYSQYEIGVLNYPLDVVIRLAKYYGVSVDYLVGLTNETTPYSRRQREK
ncbi:MAG: helix-turn-helix transcriptional regulator [Oscillibacter ruminantium]|uniref:helix-turn-helix domain-containing protein n=1 Tax=Oscillibacter ruminantium TaxID=1263547 RepID=UPI002B1F4046|nr:helix-turn-helix transcriptional regulator [Oscillibacter ruminantium]MEA5041901.1 helix-turn-helix transcriptional regulator [Oscillibacter ruminantium]